MAGEGARVTHWDSNLSMPPSHTQTIREDTQVMNFYSQCSKRKAKEHPFPRSIRKVGVWLSQWMSQGFFLLFRFVSPFSQEKQAIRIHTQQFKANFTALRGAFWTISKTIIAPTASRDFYSGASRGSTTLFQRMELPDYCSSFAVVLQMDKPIIKRR